MDHDPCGLCFIRHFLNCRVRALCALLLTRVTLIFIHIGGIQDEN